MSAELQAHIETTLDKIREPLELDRWQIMPVAGPIVEGRAACSASPEYREATLAFDFDQLKTGDVLDETIVHEITHCHTWPLHALAENLGKALANSLPKTHRRAMAELLAEEVRKAAEQVTTDVGYTYLRLLRRAGILDTPAVPT